MTDWLPLAAPCWRQRSEQNLTDSQSRAHFLRQVNGRPQHAQSLLGRSCFFRMRMGFNCVVGLDTGAVWAGACAAGWA